MSRSSSGPRDESSRHGGRGRGPDDHGWDRPAGRGGGGRLGRLFAHGDLHLLVLSMIADKPRHGYEVIKSIEARVNGAYSPSPGTIYPALTLLEEQGYIRVEASEGSRKLYAVTGEGEAYLAANRPQVEHMLARMDEVRTRRGDAPAPVVRAMENLKLALRLRLERGPLSPAEAQAIAEALDGAAVAIERS
ncbi:PadR family transcriptional regulator [Xanthobacter sp. V2C-8]|uniref:PadR family transcriptional regulator n=1 Tax=Xanthobacter albus TaxID=3119929 RepID=UPI00372CA5DA